MKDKDRVITEKILRRCDEVKAAHEMFDNQKSLFFGDSLNSSVYRNAVSMPIQQIGELAKAYSNEFIDETRHIPWKLIKGIRTYFAHEYDDIDLDIIWDSSRDDISDLSKQLHDILECDTLHTKRSFRNR